MGPTKPGCARTMTVGSWSEWRATGRRPSLKSRRQPTKPAEVPTRLLTLSLSLSSPLCHEMGLIVVDKLVHSWALFSCKDIQHDSKSQEKISFEPDSNQRPMDACHEDIQLQSTALPTELSKDSCTRTGWTLNAFGGAATYDL